MKAYLFAILFAVVIIGGCNSSKKAVKSKNIHIIHATYQHWTDVLEANTTIPERGIDLKLTVQNWDEANTPRFIIFDGYKSFHAEITAHREGAVVITARIIINSAVVRETSTKVNLTDRLVYQTEDGEKKVVIIKNWTQAAKEKAEI